MIWYHISLLLCLVGFLKDIRPSEPFVSDYMQEPYRNVTKEEVSLNKYHVKNILNILILFAVKSLHLSDCNICECHHIDSGIAYNGLATVCRIYYLIGCQSISR